MLRSPIPDIQIRPVPSFMFINSCASRKRPSACVRFFPSLELARIYGWFTEGFDTADLKEAKGLLNGLR